LLRIENRYQTSLFSIYVIRKFSEIPQFHNQIIESGIVEYLCLKVVEENGIECKSIIMRRSCVAIIANLSLHIDIDILSTLMESEDDYVKTHAERIRINLLPDHI